MVRIGNSGTNQEIDMRNDRRDRRRNHRDRRPRRPTGGVKVAFEHPVRGTLLGKLQRKDDGFLLDFNDGGQRGVLALTEQALEGYAVKVL